MDKGDRHDLYNGLGDGLARAFELALTPAIFAVLGLVLDRTLGTVPLFTIILLVFALVGTTYMAWHRYDAEMRTHEAERLARTRT